MSVLRSLVAILLSLSLVWASAQQALAHGQAPGVMQVTLCDASGQPVTLTLDAHGNPVSSHACVDCLAAHAPAILPAGAGPQLPVAITAKLDIPRHSQVAARSPRLAFLSRGPPPT